jgi:hypothetical protein
LSGTASVAALGSDVVSVSGTGAGSFADKNAGINKAVIVSGYTLTGSDAGNYNLIQPTGLTATINKANLGVSGVVASDKTYDATTTATLERYSQCRGAWQRRGLARRHRRGHVC